jgi:hypothetical protein
MPGSPIILEIFFVRGIYGCVAPEEFVLEIVETVSEEGPPPALKAVAIVASGPFILARAGDASHGQLSQPANPKSYR